MTSDKNLSIQGQHIQTIYSEFINRRFLVNRKYQRKLAWTIEEKRNFIDTLQNGLPIPLFLFAEINYEGDKVLEVIDGMQRLDAIFSFIEQKFKLKDGFFDLSTTADTIELKRKGILQQKSPILDKKTCINIANYLLPISKTSFDNEYEIEDSFRRINSNGRHLSAQELRQAGANGSFPEVVRIISSQIRGDFSNDSLFLNDMSRISISNRRLEYYGLNLFEMFWINHKIISHSALRASRDEEIVAHLISNIILENSLNYTASNLDAFYGFSPNPLAPTPIEKSKIESAIERISKKQIINQFNITFDLIEELLESNNKIFRDLIYRNPKTDENYRAFHVIFMAFYKLHIVENKRINDHKGLIIELKNIGDDLIRVDSLKQLFHHKEMSNRVNALIGRISKYFVESDIEDPAYYDWTKEFSRILMQSNTEQNLFEFKIGFYDFEKKKFNKKLVYKVAKTLSAIANLGPDKIGYVIVGIADTKADSDKYCETYGGRAIKKNNFYINGISEEAKKNCSSLETYIHQIKEEIKQAPVEPKEFLLDLLSNFKSRIYFGKEVLIFKAQSNKPVWFDGKIYRREHSHNVEIQINQHHVVYDKFYNKSKID
ncbi:GmrSD restriction endonuclease domain-containing protein [Aquimarina rhabdastrellae]